MIIIKMLYSSQETEQCQPIRRTLPSSRLIIAYATDRSLREDKIVRACCEHGVNIIIWAFTHFEFDDFSNEKKINPTFDLKNAERTIKRIRKEKDTQVIHLTSIGGWNGPHPSTRIDGVSWFKIWEKWNNNIFDGIDWDLEGHDDPSVPTTILDDSILNLMHDFTLAAQANGYIVGAAPAQSYLDPSSSVYSPKLNNQPLSAWDFSFPYAGRNAYAPLIAHLHFDFVTVQLYEGYSRACFALTRLGINPVKYLTDLTLALHKGYFLHNQPENYPRFNNDQSRKTNFVQIPPSRLVLGFANSWADGTKFVRFHPNEISQAFNDLAHLGNEPRGVAFWVLDEEGEHDHHRFFAKDLTTAFSNIKNE